MFNNVDLPEFLSRYTEIKDSDHGSELIITNCPKCFDNRGKLYVNKDKQLFICHHCTWGQGIKDIVVLLAEVSGRNFYDIKKELGSVVTSAPPKDEFLSLVESSLTPGSILRELDVDPVEVPGSTNFNSLIGRRVKEYSVIRGISEEELIKYKLLGASKARGLTGPFLVFPVYFEDTPVRWQGRRINNNTPRYVSGDHISDWLWPLSDTKLKLDFSSKEVLLVEGTFDALGAYRAKNGITPLCTFGKKISHNQLTVLKYLGIKKVYIAWDPDARREIEEAAIKLKSSFEIKIVDLSKNNSRIGKTDPGNILTDSSLVSWFNKCIEESISVNSPDFFDWRLARVYS